MRISDWSSDVCSSDLRVQPANVNGQMKGFRVYPGRERGAFNQLGLRPGDLVTQVNGIQLDDSQKALQMLTELSKANSISLTVEREIGRASCRERVCQYV